MGFNYQYYVVEYKMASAAQWRGEEPKDNRRRTVACRYQETNAEDAIRKGMDFVRTQAVHFDAETSVSYTVDYDNRRIECRHTNDSVIGIFYDFSATPQDKWSPQPEAEVTTTWWVENPKDTLTFKNGQSFSLGNGLKIAVPDGYHYGKNGSGGNQNWIYIVPQNIPLSEDHTNARPYSFGLCPIVFTKLPTSFESENVDHWKAVWMKVGVNAGLFEQGLYLHSFIVSNHCAFMYQAWYGEDDTFNTIKGLLLVEDEVYRFHAYANYSAAIACDEKNMAAFLEVTRFWMRQVMFQGDQTQRRGTSEKESSTAPATKVSPDFKIRNNRLSKYLGNDADVTIPDGVTCISKEAFEYCSLKSVTIPDSVTTIGEDAFYRCEYLRTVVIPNSVKKIGDWAFFNCSKLYDITIPDSVTSIGCWAFKDCTSLTGIVVPSSVKKINFAVFEGCTSLRSAVICRGVKEIYGRAFGGCTNLRSVVIPNSVTYIDMSAFEDCSHLTIRGSAGSYAAEYAATHGIPFMDEG